MLTVYMTGLIYFNGCNEEQKRVYAPDGTGNVPELHASLWIREADLEIEEDDWAEKIEHTLDGSRVIEFRIPSPATLIIPATGSISCSGLDGGLSKLKKKQGSNEVDLQVSATPDTIAEVPIEGGAILPRLYKGIRLVGWTIDSTSTVQITAALKSGGSRSVAVKNGAEVVFTNIPEPDHSSGDYISLFDKLTIQPGVLGTNPPTGPANPITQNDVILNFVRASVRGDTPGCCRT